MSDSLAGGLVPLAPRAGSGTSSTLSGGLVPLGNKSRPMANFRRGSFDEERQDGGGSSAGRDAPKGHARLADESPGSESDPDKKMKRSSLSNRTRRERQDTGGGGQESSSRRESSKSKSSSRRRRGSKNSSRGVSGDSPDTVSTTAGPTVSESRGRGLSGSKLGASFGGEADEQDDSYLFMGATAGAKGKKGTEKNAVEATLDYDSTDSFGLPKVRTGKTRKPELEDAERSNAISGVSTKRSAAGTIGTRDHEGMLSSPAHGRTRPPMPTGNDEVLEDKDIPLSVVREGERGFRDVAAIATTAPSGASRHELDLDEEFDSPDEMDTHSETAGSAAVNAGGFTNSFNGDKIKSRDRISDTATFASASAAAPEERDGTASSARKELSRRRSPSPPSSPRKGRFEDLQGYRTGTVPRPRPGRGLTYTDSREDLKAGRSALKEGRESDAKELGTGELDGFDRDGVASVSGADDPSSTTGVAASLPMESSRSLSRAAGVASEQDGEFSKEGEVRATVRPGGVIVEAEGPTPLPSTGVVERNSAGNSEGTSVNSEARWELTPSGPGIETRASGGGARRSALAKPDKSKSTSREPKSRGVTFDDDLVGVDALDILPGSSSDDDDQTHARGAPLAGKSLEAVPALPSASEIGDDTPVVTTYPSYGSSSSRFPADQPVDTLLAGGATGGGSVGAGSSVGSGGTSGLSISELRAPATELRGPVASSAANKRASMRMTEGLSPAAARLMEENSSSEDSSRSRTEVVRVDIGSRLGVESSDAASFAREDDLTATGGSTPLVGRGPEDGGREEKGIDIDDAKLDLALGFTPSAMEGGRKPRRALLAGRRRRPRARESTIKDASERTAPDANSASPFPASTLRSTQGSLGVTNASTLPADTADCSVRGIASDETGDGRAGEDKGDAGSTRASGAPGLSSAQPAAVVWPTDSLASAIPHLDASTEASAELSSAPVQETVTGRALDSTYLRSTDRGSNHGTTSNSGSLSGETVFPVVVAAPSKAENRRAGLKNVDVAVLASLERQLALLVSEKEALVARTMQDEQRFQRESNLARDAAAAAQARALVSEATLAEARERVRQLEAEAAEHASRLAAVESRAASDLRAEQESCLKRISEAETRHQNDLREADNRHRDVVSEVKRLHKEELEDTRKRNSDSKTLEALAGQVQASAGAVKLLRTEMMEKKNVSEVSREGHMDARERLIKELEHSARRSQQTAEEEVQRLQGTLMAMDQVMSALRGQNAGERERLRQEHLRMEALQGAMVGEVEAVRKSVDEERERLKERSAALDKEKREASAAARLESQRLAEQWVKLETDRAKFAALQVSATQAAEEMARRHADQEENLKLARRSLEREASALEARLSCARADLHKADHVRESLDRLREQDELERRRLKVLAAELARAFEEVQTRTDDTDERRREAEAVKTEALASAKAATKEREAAQLRSVQVEKVARRLEAERTSVAQARAQSATELSTSRRLKAELSRAFAAQQRHGARGTPTPADVVLSSHRVPLGQHGGGVVSDGGGDMGAGSSVGFGGSGFSGGANFDHAGSTNANSDGRDALPFTGIAAAEATLHAISCTPPFPGMDMGRELGRLARRAADIREFTREQSAFLSSSRAARFGSAAHAVVITPEPAVAVGTGAIGPEAYPPEFVPGSPPFSARSLMGINMALGREGAVWFGEQSRGRETGGIGVNDLGGALGIGLSCTVLEELDKIERACAQRSAALEEEEMFVGTLGQEERPVPV